MKQVARKHHRLLWGIIIVLLVVAAGAISVYWLQVKAHSEAQSKAAQQALAAQIEQANKAREAKKKDPVYITLPGATKIRAITEDYEKPSSLWAVANKTRPLPIDYKPANLQIPNVPERPDKSKEEKSIRTDMVAPIEKLFAAAKADGRDLMIGSAYRSATLQKLYFDNYVAQSGLEAANQYSAKPGQSEHQLGLSVDISTLSRECYLSECFTSTPDGKWLAENAYKYGFTLRYHQGKETITGYNFEPWHYRYVGIDLATALHESDFTMEEALPYLQTALATLKKNHADLQ